VYRALASGFVTLLARRKASNAPTPCHNQLSDIPTLSRRLLEEEEQAPRQRNEQRKA